jgi:hypothetical protein
VAIGGGHIPLTRWAGMSVCNQLQNISERYRVLTQRRPTSVRSAARIADYIRFQSRFKVNVGRHRTLMLTATVRNSSPFARCIVLMEIMPAAVANSSPGSTY